MAHKHTRRRPRLVRRRSKKAGMVPGSIVYMGDKKVESVRITYMDYDQEVFEEEQIGDVSQCGALKSRPTVTWINIDGLHDVDVISTVGEQFDLHPLLLEDIVNTDQRPKFEDYGSYVFVVVPMLSFDEAHKAVVSEQVSLVLGENFVLSFQEREGDVFEAVRERIRNNRGRIRRMGGDYLLYALVDAIVDGYFLILEKVGDRLEAMEDDLLDNPTERIMGEIHEMKREMISLRRSVWPLREVVSGLQRGESQVIKQATQVFLRDLYDHTIQVIDTIESFRDVVSGMLDIYLSVLSNKMNAVMKVLTIIATIFIPLTFVAGIYGMNFEHMPELKWRYGYAGVMCVMAIVAGGMVAYFKRKRWL